MGQCFFNQVYTEYNYLIVVSKYFSIYPCLYLLFGKVKCVSLLLYIVGIFANDGTFPFNLVPEKFSRLVSARVNCEFSKRDNEVWIKSTRDIRPNEELLVCYTPDGSYWKSLFTASQIQKIKEALLMCGPTLKDAENAISSLNMSSG